MGMQRSYIFIQITRVSNDRALHLTRGFNAEFDAHSTAFFKFNNSLRQGIEDASNQSNVLLRSPMFEQYYQTLSDEVRLDNFLKLERLIKEKTKNIFYKK